MAIELHLSALSINMPMCSYYPRTLQKLLDTPTAMINMLGAIWKDGSFYKWNNE